MRLIDADALEKEGWSLHRTIQVDMNTMEYQTKPLKKVPTIEPEPLTDKEQRIFLSAMGREEEVCKEVDDAWRDCREPYEDNLVRTCHEITRKVKGALWT